MENNNKLSYLFDYMNKKRWISGPLPPKNVVLLHSAAIAINKTAVIFLRASPSFDATIFDIYNEDNHKLNFIYNFESQSWTRIIDMPDQMLFSTYNLPLAITFNKYGTTLLQIFGFHDSIGIWNIFDLTRATLWTLDMGQLKWFFQDLYPEKFMGYGNSHR